MRAVVYRRYGTPDVLALEDIPAPSIRDREVLVAVRAAALNPRDRHFLIGSPLLVRLMAGLFRPRQNVLGVDVSGKVEAVGRRVTRFRPGDEVFGMLWHGGFAEYASAREDHLLPKPAALPHEEAAAIPASAVTALQGLRDFGWIRSGHKVLIHGASGGVGTFAVQLAKTFEVEVTAVCGPAGVDLVRALGADDVVDYTREDFARSGRRYDLIFDVAGKCSFDVCRDALTPGGILVTTQFSARLALRGWWTSRVGGPKLVPMMSTPSQADLARVKALVEAGRVRAVVDRCFTLSEVPEAMRYFERGRTGGKVIIQV